MFHKKIKLKPYSRGFHIITSIVENEVWESKVVNGMCHLFIKHTSASLTINENADPTVRHDLENHFNRTVVENHPDYKHDYEGKDDMPAHIKSVIIGNSLTIPIINRELALGIWQGIYLCEHRDSASSREIILSIWQ